MGRWIVYANTLHIVTETQLTLKPASASETQVSAGDDLIIETPDGGFIVGQVLSNDPQEGTFDIDGTRWSVRRIRSDVWAMNAEH